MVWLAPATDFLRKWVILWKVSRTEAAESDRESMIYKAAMERNGEKLTIRLC